MSGRLIVYFWCRCVLRTILLLIWMETGWKYLSLYILAYYQAILLLYMIYILYDINLYSPQTTNRI